MFHDSEWSCTEGFQYEEIGLLTDAELVWQAVPEVPMLEVFLESPIIPHIQPETVYSCNTYRPVQCISETADLATAASHPPQPPHDAASDIQNQSREAQLQEIRNRRNPQNRARRSGRWNCPDPNGCNLTFSRKSDAVRHFYSIHAAGAFTCPCCRRSFTRSDALRRHARSKNSCRLHCRSRNAVGL